MTTVLDSFYAAAGRLEPSEQLVARVIAQSAAAPRRREGRRRRRLVFAIAGAAILVLAASALSAASLGVIHLTDPAHELVDTNLARTTGLPVIMAAPEATSLYCEAPGRETEAGATGGDPVAICAALWRSGIASGTKQEPPPLQACVNAVGGISVYPGANACAAHGRPVAAPYSPPDIKAIELGNTLRAWAASLPGGCGNVAEATAEINKVVASMGMADDGWRIAADDRVTRLGDDGKDCIIPTVLAAKKLVYLG